MTETSLRGEPQAEVDALGLLCPLPILRAEQAIARLPAGALLALRADDDGILGDLPAWCQGNGHELLGMERRGEEFFCLVRKGGEQG